MYPYRKQRDLAEKLLQYERLTSIQGRTKYANPRLQMSTSFLSRRVSSKTILELAKQNSKVWSNKKFKGGYMDCHSEYTPILDAQNNGLKKSMKVSDLSCKYGEGK
jgi:hypothetical protein